MKMHEHLPRRSRAYPEGARPVGEDLVIWLQGVGGAEGCVGRVGTGVQVLLLVGREGGGEGADEGVGEVLF